MEQMKLRDCIGNNKIGKYERIRVFAGCQTLFNGRRADVTDNEWNIKLNPYMDCNVVRMSVSDEATVVMI